MAAKGSAAKSLLQDEVTCPVCQDIYDSEKVPKKLSCDHIFCLLCLQELITRSRIRLTCPVCRTTSPLQESDASQYPTAHQVNRLIDIYHKTLQEQAQECPVAREPAKSLKCSLHNSQPLDLYCETCQKSVCRDCALFLCAPKKHSYGFLEKVAEKYKTELDGEINPLRELHKQMIATTVAIKKDTAMLEEQKKEELGNVEAAFDLMSLNIAKQKKQITSEAQNRYEIHIVRNTSKVEELEGALDSLATAMQKTEDTDIVQSLATNKSFMFEQKRKLKAVRFQFSELLYHPRHCTELNMKLEYFPKQFDTRNSFYYIGKSFKCCLSEYNMLKMLTLKQPFQIDFHFMESKAEGKIKSNLICLHDMSSVSVKVTKVHNKITLAATPRNRGKHELHVLINDSHIFGGPIPSFVFFEPCQLPLGKAGSFTLQGATAIKCNDGNVMVSSMESKLVVLKNINKNLTITKGIHCPHINEFSVNNNLLYYSDTFHNRLVKADINGRIVASTGEKGSKPGQFDFPNGIRIKNSEVFVCDSRNGRIQVFDLDLNLKCIYGEKGAAPGQFGKPYDLVFDEEENMYIVDNYYKRVQVLSPQGNHIRFITSSRLTKPVSPALYNGHIFITDMETNCISVYTLTGTFVTSFSGGSRPECIDIDENGLIYVTNSRNSISIY